LPRDANRDQAFAVEIVYAQKISLKSSLFPRRVELRRAGSLTSRTPTPSGSSSAPVSQRLSSF